MGVGQERDFYKLRELTADDINFIKAMIRGMNAELRDVAQQYSAFFELLNIVHSIPREHDSKDALQLSLEVLHNTVEGVYEKIESIGIACLKNIKSKSFNAMDLGERFDLCIYIAHQYSRTKNIQQRVFEGAKILPVFGDAKIENCWQVLRHIFAHNIAVSLAANASYKVTILENTNEFPLITGDQPAINTFATYLNRTEVPTETEIYYPVSPSLAVLISNRRRPDTPSSLTQEEVHKYNKMIIHSSHEQIYSSNKGSLIYYLNNIPVNPLSGAK